MENNASHILDIHTHKSEDAPDSQIESFDGTVFLDCFDRIGRTGGRKPTRRRGKGRNTHPIKIDRNQQ